MTLAKTHRLSAPRLRRSTGLTPGVTRDVSTSPSRTTLPRQTKRAQGLTLSVDQLSYIVDGKASKQRITS
jgi:hypothetical protein